MAGGLTLRLSVLLGALVASSVGCKPAASPPAPPPAEAADRVRLHAAIDEIAHEAMQKRGVAGLSIAVLRGDDVVLAKGYGVADVDTSRPATPETVYQIGSITKQFTAAAVLRLVEQGKVDLDAPVSTYLPDYPPPGRDALVRQLLHHTSGIKEFFMVEGFGEMETGSPGEHTRDDLVALFEKEPPIFEPGERWAYSNSNYTLLGLIVERVSGRSYAEALRTSLFDPNGLASTRQCDGSRHSEAHATGTLEENGAIRSVPSINMNTAVGDGGLCSSVLDLARWTRALVTGRAVSRASYERMIASEPVRRGYTPAYGFGLSTVPLDGRARVAHNGEVGGFSGTLAYYPDADVTVALLTNRGRIWPEAIEKAVARAVLGVRAPALRDEPLDALAIERLVGTYDFGVFPVRVVADGSRIKFVLREGAQEYTLLHQGEQRFVARDEPDAIRIELGSGTAVIEMAGMRWYAERV